MNSQGISTALGLIHPIVIQKGLNAEVWDENGKRYIDFIGGIGVLNVGHCHPKIVHAIQHQAEQLTHYAFNAAQHRPYLDLMQKLLAYIPINQPLAGMFTNSGAEATENALKVARIATGRTGVIAFDGGFHGRTLAAVNLNGKVKPYKDGLGPLPGPVYHIPYPSKDNQVTANEAKHALKRLFQVEVDVENIAAIIFEPVLGEGGFQLMDPEFAQYLRQFCDQHGILIIADEIQSGFGRTGIPFAFAHLGIEPDLLLLGKSIAGGVPLGAVVGLAKYMDYPAKGALGGTYSGNPIACAAGLATLDIMQSAEFQATTQNYISTIENTYLRWKNQNLTPWLGRLTGVGAMRGIELCHPELGAGTQQLANILATARAQGLLLMPSGEAKNIIRLLTPLTISAEVLNEGLAILENILAATATQSLEATA
ncbi:4-aminobutyrate aminotransferase [Acinetobacter sp. ANC 4558]|uniref:2-aminoadipate transaminase n=1 Tax=Acinetobacter sp. ANC 4558 TaxID=1977876 RepID=UPI000A331343|nr:aspartate aminotransferase family protein [Acinetobacter sp. ANC 4558]OTG84180.1 4-aminobutyrate aminotransferase [Acinetobacter sp. ANC 4558]